MPYSTKININTIINTITTRDQKNLGDTTRKQAESSRQDWIAKGAEPVPTRFQVKAKMLEVTSVSKATNMLTLNLDVASAC